MTRVLRQSKIREILSTRPIRNQEQLRELLTKAGIEATQATLSRDLREIGVVKGPQGYSLNGNGVSSPVLGEELSRIVKLFLSGADSAGHIALLKTAPGNAHSLATAVDRAKIEGVLGTIAGDDAIFVLARSPSYSKRVVKALLALVRGSSS